MQMSRLSRRNRIILYVVSVLLILSMVISAIVSFTPSAQTHSVTPTAITAP